MKILLILILLAIIAVLFLVVIPYFAPPEPDEKPTPGSDNPDQWKPYR